LGDLLAASKQADRFEFVRQRNRFNRTLARVSKNPELEQMLANMQVHLVRNRLVMRPEDRAQSYATIGAAVLAGDAEAAERHARSHVRRVVEMLDDAYVPPFLGGGND
jgi:DNA-binding GntR family transcriptional regulator